MRVLVLFCVLAGAAAAPMGIFDDDDASLWAPPRAPRSRFGSLDDYISDNDMFDANRFWAHLEAALLGELLRDLSKHFPSEVSTEGVKDGNYRVVVPLRGFEEKDIIIKAQPGALMIQAVSEGTTYLNARTLPATVDVSGGRWGYEDGVLTISFPLKTTTASTTEAAPESGSREEQAQTETATVDVDARVNEADDMVRTDSPTTAGPRDSEYFFDLKGDVEFVPVQVK